MKLGRKVKKVATRGAGETGQEQGIRPEHLLAPGADEADEGHHHDERPGRGFAQSQAVDHLGAGEPVVMLDAALIDVGQHRVGAAKGDQRRLGEEFAHVLQYRIFEHQHGRTPRAASAATSSRAR